jgi:exonuclease SbcC
MILKNLRLEHYKQYAHLDLEFQEGLVGIIGKNGAGKSTIFEAILYALYGKDEISQKELIRSAFADEKAPVRLSLDFGVGDVVYRVRRELRGRKLERVDAELYKNDEQIAKGASAVTGEVIRLLNLDREAFKHSVFSGQKELSELSETKGAERTRMVRRMLGLERLDELQTTVNADKKTLKDQVSGQKQLLLTPEQLEQALAEQQQKQTALEPINLALEQAKEVQAVLEKQVAESKNLFENESAKQRQHQTLARQLAELSARTEHQGAEVQRLEKRLQQLNAEQAQWAEQAPALEKTPALQAELRKLDQLKSSKLNAEARQRELEEAKQQKDAIASTLAALQGAADNLRGKNATWEAVLAEKNAAQQAVEHLREVYNDLKGQMAALNARIGERDAQVNALRNIGKNGECPTCFQPVLQAYDKVLERLLADIADLNIREKTAILAQQETTENEGKKRRKLLEEKEQQLQMLRENQTRLEEVVKQIRQEKQHAEQLDAGIVRIQAIIDAIGIVAVDDAHYQALSNQYKELEPRFEQFRKETDYIRRELPNTQSLLDQTSVQLRQTETQRHETLLAQQQLAFRQDEYDRVFTAFSGFDQKRKAHFEAVQQLTGQQHEVLQDLRRIQDQLAQHTFINASIAEKQAEQDILEKLTELLRQFKSDILARVSPAISNYAGNLFSRITKGKYEGIRVDENFEFGIADGGVFYPIERFSGGEVDLANFCLRIAITHSIMELNGNGQTVEFLAFDEIFGSQDEERRHEMMVALNHLQEQFRQIYIISHMESQKDYFPHILEVHAAPEGSTAEWR